MKKYLLIAAIPITIILIGAAVVYSQGNDPPESNSTTVELQQYPVVAPQHRVDTNRIIIQGDKLILDPNSIQLNQWTAGKKFLFFQLKGNSMLPMFGNGAILIGLKPVSPSDLKVGDLISVHKQGFSSYVHQIVAIEQADAVWLVTTKGTNNLMADYGKVSFEEIEAYIVGGLY